MCCVAGRPWSASQQQRREEGAVRRSHSGDGSRAFTVAVPLCRHAAGPPCSVLNPTALHLSAGI